MLADFMKEYDEEMDILLQLIKDQCPHITIGVNMEAPVATLKGELVMARSLKISRNFSTLNFKDLFKKVNILYPYKLTGIKNIPNVGEKVNQLNPTTFEAEEITVTQELFDIQNTYVFRYGSI